MGDQSGSKNRNRLKKAKPLTQGASSRAAKNPGKNDKGVALSERVIDPEVDHALLETTLFESASELFESKGYKVTRDPRTGFSMLISRRVEVSNNQSILDFIPFRFHDGDGLVRYNDVNGGRFQTMDGENDSATESCNELAEKAQAIVTYLSQEQTDHETTPLTNSLNSTVEDLQTCSVRILLSKINYSKLNERVVGFWANPVFLTSSRLEDQAGNTVPWIPFPTTVAKRSVDVVNAMSLASYLDFRDREVRILGRELLSKEEGHTSFPDSLKLFRVLTVCASAMLIGAFVIFALDGGNISLALFLALGLGTSIEALGAMKLIKGYHSFQRNNAAMQGGFPNITPEQIVRNENEFRPDERAFLHWKYGGADLSKLRKETNQQRIDNLVNKSEDILNRTEKLENEELYSEVVLSCDRATRTAITSLLLSMGMDAQVKEVEEWFPHLRGIFQDIRVEDVRYLRALRDRVNKGYDASKAEAERSRQIAVPLIDETLLKLKNYRTSGDSQGIPLSQTLSPTAYSDPSARMEQYHAHLRSSISTAYSAKDNGETKTFLNKLNQAVIVATRMKILQLTGKPPTALTLTELLGQLEKSGANPRQQQQVEEAEKWINNLKDGRIETDNDVKEFENHCLGFLQSLNIIHRSKTGEDPRITLNTIEPKLASNSLENKPVSTEPDIETETTQPLLPETSFREISKDILDPASNFKFLLDATEDKELLDIGPCGARLLEAKKEFQKSTKPRRSKQNVDVRNEPTSPRGSRDDDLDSTHVTPVTMATPPKFCDELDNITKSLDQLHSRTEQAGNSVHDSDRPTLDVSTPVAKVMPIGNLGDFKKIVSCSEFPVVASYLSDDEPSKAIDNAMRQLVRKYHEKAAFYSVDSKFKDIAIESKIKSYPAVLVFNNGKLMTEVKSSELEQLDRELSTILETSSVDKEKEVNRRQPLSRKDSYEGEDESEGDSEGEKLRKVD
jgi:hypothetical protein